MSDKPLGRFGWYELMTTDPGAARDFYTQVTGWETERWEGGAMPYTMWMAGETAVGGLMALPPEAREAGAPPHWLAYLTVPDAEAAVEEVKEMGGSVVWGPTDVEGVGRVVGIADPQGGHLALHEPAGDAPGHDSPPDVGEFSWNELATSDWEAAWAFYSRLFEWQKADALDMGPDGTYQMFHRGAQPLGGMYTKPDLPTHWLVYVRVADIQAAVEKAQDLGGQLLNGPMEVPGGDRVAQLLDPQGAAFALHERKG
jgi:predicted enzyme related to lactoylglutathione lyase